jgi:hypothetical protein
MIVEDNRTPTEKDTHRWLVVMTDTWMSGWGDARRGSSFAAWACEDLKTAEQVADRVRKRSDASRVRIVHDRGYRPRCAHFQVYTVDEHHRYAAAA